MQKNDLQNYLQVRQRWLADIEKTSHKAVRSWNATTLCLLQIAGDGLLNVVFITEEYKKERTIL